MKNTAIKFLVGFFLSVNFSFTICAAGPAFGEGALDVEISKDLEQQLCNLGVFQKLDALRIFTEHPSFAANFSTVKRVDIYEGYISDLQAFGLLPKNELKCLLSLSISKTLKEEDSLRIPKTILDTSDPCYPKVGRRNVQRPTAWQMDELLRGSEQDPAELGHGGGGRGGAPANSEDGNGGRGTTGGGSGRQRTN